MTPEHHHSGSKTKNLEKRRGHPPTREDEAPGRGKTTQEGTGGSATPAEWPGHKNQHSKTPRPDPTPGANSDTFGRQTEPKSEPVSSQGDRAAPQGSPRGSPKDPKGTQRGCFGGGGGSIGEPSDRHPFPLPPDSPKGPQRDPKGSPKGAQRAKKMSQMASQCICNIFFSPKGAQGAQRETPNPTHPPRQGTGPSPSSSHSLKCETLKVLLVFFALHLYSLCSSFPWAEIVPLCASGLG